MTKSIVANKLGESQSGYLFFKEYLIDPDYGIGNIVYALINNGYKIKYINIKEDADIGCKQYPFDYSAEEFLSMYYCMDKSEISLYHIEFVSEVETLVYDPNTNRAYLYPLEHNKDIELSDMI